MELIELINLINLKEIIKLFAIIPKKSFNLFTITNNISI